MKKTICFICLAIIAALTTRAQNGLEHVEVETFYISNANDTMANVDGGVLPVGSVTYRIFADMLPGYQFQAVYGEAGHEMRIETNTFFFNNLDRGNTSPTFTLNQCADNTVMLDSYLSVGGSCNTCIAVPKDEDDSVNTIINNYSPQVLQNNNPLAGIPVNLVDGKFSGTPTSVTFVGITPDIFNDLNDGPLFSSDNGSWASLSGSQGYDSLSNKVLVAQITTNGKLSFKLNMQIRKLTPNGPIVEKYVAENPVGSEILFPELNFVSDTTAGSRTIFASDRNPTWSVYPNPFNDFISIASLSNTQKFTENQMVRIYNMEGKVVYHKAINSMKETVRMDLQTLNNGIYLLEIAGEGDHMPERYKIIRN
jgi:hypothetical protein